MVFRRAWTAKCYQTISKRMITVIIRFSMRRGSQCRTALIYSPSRFFFPFYLLFFLRFFNFSFRISSPRDSLPSRDNASLLIALLSRSLPLHPSVPVYSTTRSSSVTRRFLRLSYCSLPPSVSAVVARSPLSSCPATLSLSTRRVIPRKPW